MKFINSKTTSQYAEDLHKTNTKISKLKARIKALEVEATQLEAFILKDVKGKSFELHDWLL